MNNKDAPPGSLDLPDGRLSLFPNFLPAAHALEFVQYLRHQVSWNHEIYYGKPTRRGTAWFADEGVEYRYSGQSMVAEGWTPQLEAVRNAVQEHCGCEFNSVLLNHYPDGRAQMGWHSDDEPELGQNPSIASLSFGATRMFKLRHKQTRETHECLLEDNSLLLMTGELQHHWQHTLPRRSEKVGERFNLTFRYTIPGFWQQQES